MSGRDDILEQNLQRLFERAHRPVRPTAEFRERLARALERRSLASRPARVTSIYRRVDARILAAAGVMLVAALGYIAYRTFGASAPTLESILARGSVAVRETPRSEWSEIDAQTARHGLDFESCRLRVATPRALALDVRLGSAGNVTVDADTRAELDMQPVLHVVSLSSGGTRIENLAGAEQHWSVGGAGSVVELERGVLHARLAPCGGSAPGTECLIVLLEHGRARVNGTHDLQIGVECALAGDRILSATVGVEPPLASRRTSAAIGGALTSDPAEPVVQPEGSAGLVGTIVRAAGDPDLGSYMVTLLRHERLPAISRPDAHAFHGAEQFTIRPLTPGTYDVFVEFEDRAPWSARGIEIETDKLRELSIVTTSGTSLFGRVVADATGKPIENALVIVEDLIPAQVIQFDADGKAWSASARTDSSGAFRCEHIPSGAHVLRATAAGFGAAWSARMDFDGTNAIELRLSTPGALAGRVAHDDGQPWRGAIVIASFLRQEGGFDRFSYGVGIADEDGHYSIPDLPAGGYVLLNVLDTNPDREATASRQVHVNAGATTTANLPDTIDGPRFHGRVLDASGAPLGGLDVTLQPHGIADDSNWRSQRADAGGQFVFASVPATTYDVFVGENLGESFAWVEELTVPPGGDFEHDIRLGAGRIRGRAVSKEAVIGGAFVMLQREERDVFVFAGRVRTDPLGGFAFERLQEGTYRTTVFPAQKGLAPQASAELWIARNGPLAECELTVERGAALTVVVRDAHGAALANVPLNFVDGAGHAESFRANDVTGADGRYAIDGLAAGRWTVSACPRGGATITHIIELNVGDERELVLTLP